MLRIFTAALLALLAGPALAQSFPQPTDIIGVYSQVVPDYESGSGGSGGNAANEHIDAQDDPPDYASVELTDPVTHSESGRLTATNAYTSQNDSEFKFRMHNNFVKIAKDDPIRNFKQPGQSHCHMFSGNEHVNSASTFASLRTDAASFNGGAELQATSYWMPCIQLDDPFGDGKDYVKWPDYMSIYYNDEEASADTDCDDPANDDCWAFSIARIPLGLRYVAGADMDDAYDWLQTILTAENATVVSNGGMANRYTLSSSAGVYGYRLRIACYPTAGGEHVLYNGRFLESDGTTDPFDGDCTAGTMSLDLPAGECWDGVHLWSPGGYKHVIPAIYDNTVAKWVCPKNYYRLARLELRVIVTHGGFSDYGRWFCSSDEHYATVVGAAVDACESFHADWFGAWQEDILLDWQEHCLRVMGGGDVGRGCNSGTVGTARQLLQGGAAPNGRNPQVDLTQTFDSTAEEMREIPADWDGPVTLIADQ